MCRKEKQGAINNMIPKVKICGITSLEDISIINKYRPEYAGFVFYERSKRNLNFEKARELLSKLDESICPVAVVVSPDMIMLEAIEGLGFGILQVHGKLEKDVISRWKGSIWQAVNIAGQEMPSVVRDDKVVGYVVDGANYGGGETFDWEQEHIKKSFEVLKDKDQIRILAGGLNPDNLRIGIERFAPDVVDVSSGVEGAQGKDSEKVRLFIQCARLKG